MERPSQDLTDFALWTLEQTLDRMVRSGGSPAPVVWYLVGGARQAALFADDAPIDVCREHARGLVADCYAIVYDAVHEVDGVRHAALVAEAGDTRLAFHYGIVYHWDEGRPVPNAREISVSPLGASLLARSE